MRLVDPRSRIGGWIVAAASTVSAASVPVAASAPVAVSALIVPFVLVFGTAERAVAQTGPEAASRFRFASTYVGLDVQGLPAGDAWMISGSGANPLAFDIPARGTARLTIGGLHFWGQADFYVAVPLASWGPEPDAAAPVEVRSSRGIEVGGRVFAVPLRPGRLVPFAGVALAHLEYRQEQGGVSGPEYHYFRPAFQAGLAWMNALGSLEAGLQYVPSTEVDYPLSRTRTATIGLPSLGAWIGFKRHFDVTMPNGPQRASGQLAGAERRLAEQRPQSGFTLQVGAATAFTASASAHNAAVRPFLGERLPPAASPEFGIGYHMHPWDAAVNLSFRRYSQHQSGFGFEQEGRRTVLGVEAIKFLGDYHGFVPFVGPMLGLETVRFNEMTAGGQATGVQETAWRFGVVAGWDIRPTGREWWVLRTNIRYTPRAGVSTEQGRMAFDHIEVDFIQLVVYPQRLLAR